MITTIKSHIARKASFFSLLLSSLSPELITAKNQVLRAGDDLLMHKTVSAWMVRYNGLFDSCQVRGGDGVDYIRRYYDALHAPVFAQEGIIKSRLVNLAYDAADAPRMPLIASRARIERLPDDNVYSVISKQNALNDISHRHILQVLLCTHKINRYEYAETIKRGRIGKAPREKVRTLINAYLSTLKASTRRGTMRHLRMVGNPRPTAKVSLNGQAYLITLLRHPVNPAPVTLRDGITIRTSLKGQDLTPYILREASARMHARNSINAPAI